MKLKKGKNVINLTDPIQIAAYKHADWKEVPARAAGNDNKDGQGGNDNKGDQGDSGEK